MDKFNPEDYFLITRDEFFNGNINHQFYQNYEINALNAKEHVVTTKAIYNEGKCQWSSIHAQSIIFFSYDLVEKKRKKIKINKRFHIILFKQKCKSHKVNCDDYTWYDDDLSQFERILNKIFSGGVNGRSRTNHSHNMKSNHPKDLCLGCKYGICYRFDSPQINNNP